MQAADFLQLTLLLLLLVIATPVLGRFMTRVFLGERTLLHRFLEPLERGLYKMGGLDPTIDPQRPITIHCRRADRT